DGISLVHARATISEKKAAMTDLGMNPQPVTSVPYSTTAQRGTPRQRITVACSSALPPAVVARANRPSAETTTFFSLIGVTLQHNPRFLLTASRIAERRCGAGAPSPATAAAGGPKTAAAHVARTIPLVSLMSE